MLFRPISSAVSSFVSLLDSTYVNINVWPGVSIQKLHSDQCRRRIRFRRFVPWSPWWLQLGIWSQCASTLSKSEKFFLVQKCFECCDLKFVVDTVATHHFIYFARSTRLNYWESEFVPIGDVAFHLRGNYSICGKFDDVSLMILVFSAMKIVFAG